MSFSLMHHLAASVQSSRDFHTSGLLFGPPNFQGRVRRILIERCLACLSKNPQLLRVHLVPIIEIMMSSGASSGVGGDSSSGLRELALNMCWIVGEHATAEVVGLRAVTDLFGALETLAYEHIFASSVHADVAADTTGSKEDRRELITTRNELYGTRLLHVLISVSLGSLSSFLFSVAHVLIFSTRPFSILVKCSGIDKTGGSCHGPVAPRAAVPE